MSIRVVLVDDHPIVLQGLQHLFERQADFEVVSCCEDAATAIEAVRAQHPDVLVLGCSMSGSPAAPCCSRPRSPKNRCSKR
ncbi:MAG: hypothetical protein DMG03_13520 [Acidobacteria bacterium]|nr:MAG: hypothetical protein DMG03_13520 [Acidobacteriota bacterium]